MRTFFIHALITLVLVSMLLMAGALLFIYTGTYNVAATQQHTRPVYWLLDSAMRQSVRQHANEIRVPSLTDPALIKRGFHCYRAKCLQCHGAPGVPRDDVGKGLTPIPVALEHTARQWPPAEIYWVIKYGIKMSGMPAWQFRLTDEDRWAIVAFMKQLPTLSPQDYQALSQALGIEPCER